VIIRPITERDLTELVELCAEHAAFERAVYQREDKLERLNALLFGREPSLRIWVAESEGTLVAYASATIDTSTWAAERFIHMDCLFVRASHRNLSIGARLLRRVALEGMHLGIGQMQWQTPTWNVNADRFYRRMPVIVTDKFRYQVGLDEILHDPHWQ
jgi:GNAT superfamily N-acetyltransferase